MNYNKTTWNNGDIITSEKLNNLENGVAAASGGGIIDLGTYLVKDMQVLTFENILGTHSKFLGTELNSFIPYKLWTITLDCSDVIDYDFYNEDNPAPSNVSNLVFFSNSGIMGPIIRVMANIKNVTHESFCYPSIQYTLRPLRSYFNISDVYLVSDIVPIIANINNKWYLLVSMLQQAG